MTHHIIRPSSNKASPSWYHSACCPCLPYLGFECDRISQDHRIVDTTDMFVLVLSNDYDDLWTPERIKDEQAQIERVKKYNAVN